MLQGGDSRVPFSRDRKNPSKFCSGILSPSIPKVTEVPGTSGDTTGSPTDVPTTVDVPSGTSVSTLGSGAGVEDLGTPSAPEEVPVPGLTPTTSYRPPPRYESRRFLCRGGRDTDGDGCRRDEEEEGCPELWEGVGG